MANFFFNEISFTENVQHVEALHTNINELIKFHKTVTLAKHTVFLHREALYRSQVLGHNFRSSIANNCKQDTVRKIRSLIDKSFPALPDDGVLDEQTKIFWNEQNISNTALGECAARIHINEGSNSCYSLSNSSFTSDSISVEIIEKNTTQINVPNFHTITNLEPYLNEEFAAFENWENIIDKAKIFLKSITFENYVLENLKAFPFSKNVANDVYTKLAELNELSSASQENFYELREKYCVGDKAHFTGSSDGEKRDFKEELSFIVNGNKIICPFHGKVKNQQYRIHMAGTPQPETIARIVYIGPKLTKK